MTAPRRYGLPYVWVTWITGLLSGDRQCQWAAWYRANFRYQKRPDPTFDSAAWTWDHNRLVQQRREQFLADDWSVTVEGQNDIKFKGHTAVLAGKPDLIAVRGDELLVSDAKTGKQRAGDWWQVLIYMLALPRVRPLAVRPERISGEVVYGNVVVPVAARDLTPERSEQIFQVLRVMGGAEEPARTPSAHECLFCDVAECPDRMEQAPDQQLVAASEF
jgi:hypothetical protein